MHDIPSFPPFSPLFPLFPLFSLLCSSLPLFSPLFPSLFLSFPLNREAKTTSLSRDGRARPSGAFGHEKRTKARPRDNQPTSPRRTATAAGARVPPPRKSPWGAKTRAGAGPLHGVGAGRPHWEGRGGAGWIEKFP